MELQKKYDKLLLDYKNLLEREKDYTKITRFEVINHANNDRPIGRLLTMYHITEDFNKIELSFQDNGSTLKVFLL